MDLTPEDRRVENTELARHAENEELIMKILSSDNLSPKQKLAAFQGHYAQQLEETISSLVKQNKSPANILNTILYDLKITQSSMRAIIDGGPYPGI